MSWFDTIFRMTMKSSLLWGSLATVAFYTVLDMCVPWAPPLLLRSLTGRWEAYVCMAMFFVGVANLAIKAVELAQQAIAHRRVAWTATTGKQSATVVAKALQTQLEAQPKIWQGTCLVRRFRDALDFVVRKGSGESLEEHLRYLADMDIVRMNASYGLTRFMAWAIPAVGSLGTVLGIAAAVGNLSVAPESDSLNGVAVGLATAFDTMALSLGLSILLVCLKFVCEQQENALLLEVEQRVERDLSAALGPVVNSRSSPNDQIRKLTETVAEFAEKMSQQQAGMMRESLQHVDQRWAEQSAAIVEQLAALVSHSAAAPAAGAAGGNVVMMSGGDSMTGFAEVQEALQQIAQFFARQNARQMRENEVLDQIAETVHDGSSAIPARHVRAAKATASDAGALDGLWSTRD